MANTQREINKTLEKIIFLQKIGVHGWDMAAIPSNRRERLAGIAHNNPDAYLQPNSGKRYNMPKFLKPERSLNGTASQQEGRIKDLPLKVLVFARAFHKVGGIETMTMILARNLKRMGHQVKIVVHKPSEVDFGDIEAYSAPSALKKLRLYRWCDTFYMPEMALEGTWLRLFGPFKKWVISHNSYYLENGGFYATTKRLLIKGASNISASQSIAGGIGTRSTVIRYCYDVSTFRLYPDEKRSFDFVFAGRLVAYKGCAMLIRACAELDRRFTLTVIGDGEDRAGLEHLVDILGLSASVRFTGFLTGEALARMLNRHRVMVMPNIEKEGFGIMALEGLACGCRMVAASAGGLCEAVDRFGDTFRMGDQDELVRLMHRELDGRATVGHTRQELEDYLKGHAPEVAAQNYLSFFR